MLALRNLCVHPTSQQTYIKSLTGGLDNSPEGLQVCQGTQKLTHFFVFLHDAEPAVCVSRFATVAPLQGRPLCFGSVALLSPFAHICSLSPQALVHHAMESVSAFLW
jgi:hypothetical protein